MKYENHIKRFKQEMKDNYDDTIESGLNISIPRATTLRDRTADLYGDTDNLAEIIQKIANEKGITPTEISYMAFVFGHQIADMSMERRIKGLRAIAKIISEGEL